MSPSTSSAPAPRALIAEDEPDIRDLVAFTLRFAGHEVVAVANGLEASGNTPIESVERPDPAAMGQSAG